MILSEPKAVYLSLLGLLVASSPQRALLNPFPLPLQGRYLVAEHHKVNTPQSLNQVLHSHGEEILRPVWSTRDSWH
jgi:hypothetical protein